jgi:phytanoyl-CoA hydroxylase
MKQKIEDFYKKNGVIYLEKFFKLNEINTLKKKIKSYIEKNKNNLKGKDINFVEDKVNSIHNFKDYFFKSFSKQKKIINIVQILLDDKPGFRKCEYFAKPKNIGLESPLHQDNYYWNLKNGNGLTIWIPLDHVNKNNGSLKYLLKTHTLGVVPHEASHAPGSSQKVSNVNKFKKKFKAKIYQMSPGDCLIHHSQVIHGSIKNKTNKNRRAFTIQFVGKKENVDLKKLKIYQESLRKQIKLRSLEKL